MDVTTAAAAAVHPDRDGDCGTNTRSQHSRRSDTHHTGENTASARLVARCSVRRGCDAQRETSHPIAHCAMTLCATVIRGIEQYEAARDAVPHAVLRAFVEQSLRVLSDAQTSIDRATVSAFAAAAETSPAHGRCLIRV